CALPISSVFERGHLASCWLDLARRRLCLDRLAATAVADFFPLPAAPAFLAQQTSRPLAVLRFAPARNRVRRRSLPACRSPSRLRWSRARTDIRGELPWRTSARSRRSM